MSQLIETIKILNGRVYNIKYHNERCNRSRKALFDSTSKINLRKSIIIPKPFRKGLVKCRITFKDQIEQIEFSEYKRKSINSVQCVYTNHLNYNHKSKDRKALDALYAKRGKHDDILIVNNKCITDGYYTNLAFFDGKVWCSPKECLLQGTQRQKLIDQRSISIKSIRLKDLNSFECFSMFNALIPFKSLILPCTSIYQ